MRRRRGFPYHDTTVGRAARFLVLALLAVSAGTGADLSPATGQQAEHPRSPVVRLPFPKDDGTLTPYTFALGYPLMTLVYDTLLWRDDDGLPQPWLAQAVEVGADGTRITIRLHPGARWHDGTALTASDVAFTFEYVGQNDHPRFTPQLRSVRSVDVVDAATVVVTLHHPSPGFLHQPLADLPILPAHLWRSLPRDQLAPPGLPVGSGPYRLVEHVEGKSYRFEAFDDHFRGRPAVGTIEVPVIGSVDDSIRSLRRGEVDMVPVSLPDAYRRALGSRRIRVRQGPLFTGTVLLLNVRRAPFDQIGVRRALAGALEPAAVAEAVGSATAATHGYLHPLSVWAPPAPDRPAAGRPVEAPATAGSPVEVLVADNDPLKERAARLVESALRQVGVPASVRLIAPEALSEALGEGGDEPTFSAAVWTTPSLPSYDPDFLAAMFGPAGATLNPTGYRSADFDSAARRVAKSVDPAGRRAAVGDLLRVLAADAPAVPLYFADGAFAYRPRAYDGWRFVKGSGLLDKRSFTDPSSPAATRAAAPTDPSGQQASGGRRRSPFGWGALGLLASAALLALAALTRRR